MAEGKQIGIQVCAYKDGERVVDTWAGTMGPNDPRPVSPDTLFFSWSTTKGVAATLVHILADRGLIDYDAPVASYWPGFARNGKEKITLAQVLSHRSGLHRVPVPHTIDSLTDWDAWVKALERSAPAYPPGTRVGYQAYTVGFIIGEVVRLVTGKSIGKLVQEEIALPLCVDREMYIGVPPGVEDRLATLKIWDMPRELEENGVRLPTDCEQFKAMPNDMWQHMNDIRVRRAEIPGANGHFTARALAKMYSSLTNGENSMRLVSTERVLEMQRLVTDDYDTVLEARTRKGLGYFLGGKVDGVVGVLGSSSTAFGHPGAGGSVAYADPSTRLSVAVTLNKMAQEPPGAGRTQEICDTIREELA